MENGFCFNCGARLPEGTTVCPACGHDTAETQQAAMYSQQPYPGQPAMNEPRMQQPYAQNMQSPQFIQQQGQYDPAVQQPYMQMPPPVQPYYGQYAMMEQPKKTSVFSKIIGVLLILLGLPLMLLFGLATLGMFSGVSDGGWVAGLVMLFLTALCGCLIAIGVKQFIPRKPKFIQQPMMPQYMQPQQPYQQPPVQQQWGQAGYQQPQQNGYAAANDGRWGYQSQPAQGNIPPQEQPMQQGGYTGYDPPNEQGGGVDLTKR